MELIYYILLTSSSSLFCFFGGLFLLFPLYFDYILAEVANDQKISDFRKQIIFCSSIYNSNPNGLIFGYYFIGYIYLDEKGFRYMKIFSTKNFLLKNKFCRDSSEVSSDDFSEKDSDDSILYYERNGRYENLYYNELEFSIKYEPLESQLKIVDTLESYNRENNSFSVVLSGPPGSGKSMLPIFLAQRINGCIVDSFNPTDPGDSIFKITSSVEPTSDKKLIIVMEEIDVLLEKIVNNSIEKHKNIHVEISNKQDWNKFLDKIDRNIYSNIILIMTTNKDIDFFNNLDPSFLRNGRLDFFFLMKKLETMKKTIKILS